MPSRPILALIVAFWLATTGFVVYRDVWPLLASSGPPAIAVELSDEASQFTPIRWTIYRGDAKAGRVETRMTYHDPDDTFWVGYKYTQMELQVGGVAVAFPEVTSAVRITRAGALREQTLNGRMVIKYAGVEVEARAAVAGRVENGQLVGECEFDVPVAPQISGKSPLGPVDVPDGHALSPLQPVNRLGRLHPGQTWGVRQVDPLAEAVGAMFTKRVGGLGLLDRKAGPLVARVSDAPQDLAWHRHTVPCWVIEYTEAGEVKARTWVRVDDGRVLRQEAYQGAERLAIERDE